MTNFSELSNSQPLQPCFKFELMMEKGIACLLTYGSFLSAPSQGLLLLTLACWFCFPAGRNSRLRYLITTVSWDICESICLLIFREVEGNTGGPGSWFLDSSWGKMVCSKSFIFPMVGGSGLPFPPPCCWVPWQNFIACFWSSEAVDKGYYLEVGRRLSRTVCAWRLGRTALG